MRKIFWLFVLLMVSYAALAQIPTNSGKYITDVANVLGQRQLDSLNRKLADIENNIADHPQVVALLVNSTGEKDIHDFSVEVFNNWRIGRIDKKNGVLLTIAVKDRKVAIVTGNGADFIITDIQTREITDKMKPAMVNKNWYNAVVIYAEQASILFKKEQGN